MTTDAHDGPPAVDLAQDRRMAGMMRWGHRATRLSGAVLATMATGSIGGLLVALGAFVVTPPATPSIVGLAGLTRSLGVGVHVGAAVGAMAAVVGALLWQSERARARLLALRTAPAGAGDNGRRRSVLVLGVVGEDGAERIVAVPVEALGAVNFGKARFGRADGGGR